jgi:hypothetical protein
MWEELQQLPQLLHSWMLKYGASAVTWQASCCFLICINKLLNRYNSHCFPFVLPAGIECRQFLPINVMDATAWAATTSDEGGDEVASALAAYTPHVLARAHALAEYAYGEAHSVCDGLQFLPYAIPGISHTLAASLVCDAQKLMHTQHRIAVPLRLS